MDCLKIPINQLKEEPSDFGCPLRYSHKKFAIKLPEGMAVYDFDKDKKLVKWGWSEGDCAWIPMEALFGIMISEVKDLFILRKNGDEERIYIVGVDNFKIERDNCIKLIFETELSF